MDIEKPKHADAVIWTNKDKLRTLLFYEFLGTAVITYAYTLSNGNSLIRSLGYFIMFIFAYQITGAHFNPATTFACYLSDKISGYHNTPELRTDAPK